MRTCPEKSMMLSGHSSGCSFHRRRRAPQEGGPVLGPRRSRFRRHATSPQVSTGPGGWYAATMTKADLHRLVDALPDASVEPAAVVLERIRDPFVAAHFAAPFDDEPVSAEEEALAAESRAAIARGEGVPLDQVTAEPGAERD